MFFFIFAIVLSVLIVVHEWGHFYMAKRLGIRVERFSVGFGPKILSLRKGETEYRLSLVPLGGYVKLGGETHKDTRGEKWEYLSRPVGERFAVVFAGPLLNYLLAFVLFWGVFVTGYPRLTTRVGKVMDDFPAKAAGILEGDRILSVNDQEVEHWDDVTRLIRETPEGMPVHLSAEREGRERTFHVVAKPVEEKNLFGEKKRFPLVGIAPSEEVRFIRHPVHEALWKAAEQLGSITLLTFKALGRIVTGHLPLRESLTGPIGIFMITEQAFHLGLAYLLQMVALLSASLAIFNVLPIPVLDGGHLFFLVLERLKGKPVSERAQEVSQQLGMAFLIGLMIVVFYNDFARFGVFEKLSSWFGGS